MGSLYTPFKRQPSSSRRQATTPLWTFTQSSIALPRIRLFTQSPKAGPSVCVWAKSGTASPAASFCQTSQNAEFLHTQISTHFQQSGWFIYLFFSPAGSYTSSSQSLKASCRSHTPRVLWPHRWSQHIWMTRTWRSRPDMWVAPTDKLVEPLILKHRVCVCVWLWDFPFWAGGLATVPLFSRLGHGGRDAAGAPLLSQQRRVERHRL